MEIKKYRPIGDSGKVYVEVSGDLRLGEFFFTAGVLCAFGTWFETFEEITIKQIGLPDSTETMLFHLSIKSELPESLAIKLHNLSKEEYK